ncbi:fimbrial protein [Enterobacter ludwigii]|uniref:fimbrial protein n=1 Tax=Enterobacter ludwigii TaxID=299767 RepID=UPI00244AF766|nr:pilus assembly protein [Enterobacter ludwigii]MDH1548039.1 pilus assembly protein [Enterobacter ludwigii]
MKKILITSAVVTALTSYGAMAIDANINFRGAVSSTTCKLNAADAAKTLTIPNVTAKNLLDSGDSGRYSASSSFNFTDCPAGLTKVTSAYTYQGKTIFDYGDWVVANGAANVAFSVMQSPNADGGRRVQLNGRTDGKNDATITNGVATVPVTVGVAAFNSNGEYMMPSAGTYSGTFLVAFTYS